MAGKTPEHAGWQRGMTAILSAAEPSRRSWQDRVCEKSLNGMNFPGDVRLMQAATRFIPEIRC